MEEKPLYQYPPTLSRQERQALVFRQLAEHRKMRRQMYKNIIIGGVIFVLAFFVPVILVRILLIIIAVLNVLVGVLLYRYYTVTAQDGLYTRIYEDRLEHMQPLGLMGDKLKVTLRFEDIVKSSQNNRGRLEVHLKEGHGTSAFKVSKAGAETPQEVGELLVLRFDDAQPKLKLVKDYADKIKYPKKNYVEISDDDPWYDEEDLKWDNLHKHGL